MSYRTLSSSIVSLFVLVGGTALAACSSSPSDGEADPNDGSGGSGTSDNSDEGEENAGGADGSGGRDSVADTVAPEVVAVSPRADTDGVEEDEVVTLTFSEAMDTDSVESALTVTDFDTDALDLSWNGDNTVLTIVPAEGWAYAEGTSEISVQATQYTVLVSRAATDLAGNGLEASGRTSFTTLRRLSKTLRAAQETTAYTYIIQVVKDSTPSDCTAGAAIDSSVGSREGSVSGGDLYIYLHFNVGGLGSAERVEVVESANFFAEQTRTDAGFYPDGAIGIEQLSYGAIDETATFDLPVVSGVGTLSTDAEQELSLDVSSHLWDVWSAGTTNVVYRISEIGDAPENTYSYLKCGEFSIEVTYLTP